MQRETQSIIWKQTETTWSPVNEGKRGHHKPGLMRTQTRREFKARIGHPRSDSNRQRALPSMAKRAAGRLRIHLRLFPGRSAASCEANTGSLWKGVQLRRATGARHKTISR